MNCRLIKNKLLCLFWACLTCMVAYADEESNLFKVRFWIGGELAEDGMGRVGDTVAFEASYQEGGNIQFPSASDLGISLEPKTYIRWLDALSMNCYGIMPDHDIDLYAWVTPFPTLSFYYGGAWSNETFSRVGDSLLCSFSSEPGDTVDYKSIRIPDVIADTCYLRWMDESGMSEWGMEGAPITMPDYNMSLYAKIQPYPMLKFYVNDTLYYYEKHEVGELLDTFPFPQVPLDSDTIISVDWVPVDGYYMGYIPEDGLSYRAVFNRKPLLKISVSGETYRVFMYEVGEDIDLDLSTIPSPTSNSMLFAGWMMNDRKIERVRVSSVNENQEFNIVARWAPKVANVVVKGVDAGRYYTGEKIQISGYTVSSDNVLFTKDDLKLLTTDTISAVEVGLYSSNMKFVSTNKVLDSVSITVVQSKLSVLEPYRNTGAIMGGKFYVDENGQTLYYEIIDENTVSVTYPAEKPRNEAYLYRGDAEYYKYFDEIYEYRENSMYYGDYMFPSGDIVIPSEVEYEGVKYSVKAISDHAFSNCIFVTGIDIPASVQSIGVAAFERTSIEKLTLPSSIKAFAPWMCADCDSLKEVVLETKSVDYVGDYAFGQRSKTLFVSCGLEDRVRGFQGYLGGVDVVSGELVVLADGTKCCVCDSFATIIEIPEVNGSYVLPESVSYNDMTYRVNRLTRIVCDDLVTQNIIVNDLAQWVDICNNTELIYYGFKANVYYKGEPIVEETVQGELFPNQLDVNDLVISVDSVTYYKNVFDMLLGKGWWNRNVQRLTIVGVDSVIELSSSILYNMYALRDLNVVNVKEMKSYALGGCSELRHVTFSADIKEIAQGAFSGCEKLESLTILSQEPPVVKDYFWNSVLGVSLIVPCDAREAYEKDTIWNTFKEILCIGAEKIEDTLSGVVVEEGMVDVVVSWPVVESASAYVLRVYKDDDLYGTWNFDAEGRLKSADYVSLRRGSEGFRFNIVGLDENSNYTYVLEAVDESSVAVKKYQGAFRTHGGIITDESVTHVDGDDVVYVEKRCVVARCSQNQLIEIYNYNGQKLVQGYGELVYTAPCGGLYVVKFGDSVVKVLVK